jgi:hypothetical protein
VLLDREVPDVPGVRAVPQQGGFLIAGRLETVYGTINVRLRPEVPMKSETATLRQI